MRGPGEQAEWFANGLDLGIAGGGQFLDDVRSRAEVVLGPLIGPDDTWSTDYAMCLLVVDVPGLPPRGTSSGLDCLQVRWADGQLEGCWASRHLWDDFDPRDEDALVVHGIALEEDAAAEAALSWLAHQLARPVDHQVWQRGGRVAAQRWVLGDTRRRLASSGSRLARRRPPTSTVRARPGASSSVIRAAMNRVVDDCSCPDLYYCPSSDDVECPRHGGFGVCCLHPGAHAVVPSSLRRGMPGPSERADTDSA